MYVLDIDVTRNGNNLKLKVKSEFSLSMGLMVINHSNPYIHSTTVLCDIVNFPYLSSNIPSGPAYGVYISQLVRIGRICSNYTQFTWRHYKLTQRLIHQGFRYSTLCIAFRKFARKYTQVLEKYGWSIRKHIEDGVCLQALLQWIRS